jgi:Ser/Thr protein kinase RdoA (MazF antagonist)
VPAGVRGHPVPWVEWAGADEGLGRCLGAVEGRPEGLLHLDYHPRNVLAAGGRITAVLDWANARGGDPRADLARTASILRLMPVGRGPRSVGERGVRAAFLAGWRRGYEGEAGPIGELAPFNAWAGTLMERDLAPRVGRPDLPWLTPAFMGRVRRWTAEWRVRAGCGE